MPPRTRATPSWRRWGTVAFLSALMGLCIIRNGPPPALPVDALSSDFSAARALRHVEAIAREPHPLGSAAAEPVRRYIIEELGKLGLESELQRPRSADPARPWRASVVNIVARWRGTGPPDKKALLLAAHYDSVPRGPGAGDDAAGVAAILESLRALKAGPAPERDLIILIDDGEEAGLYGAEVFAAEHPRAGDVGAVINLEGRGNSGPSFMFETSEGNGWLVAQMARALPHPMASSLTYEVYRLMPNDTDLTIFKRHGMAGWNFAFVGGLAYYHSPDDTPANLDRRTLQHQGENVLAMARHLSRLDLDDVRRQDVIYCSILQWFVVIYPLAWAIPLLGIALALYAAVLVLGVRRGRIRPAEVAAGFGAMLVALPASALAVGLLWAALAGPMARAGLVIPRPDLGHGAGMPTSRHDVGLLAGSAALALVITASIFAAAARRWRWEGLGLGALAWWLAATLATSLWMPGASYAFAWPLLALLVGQALAFARPRGSRASLFAAWLAAVPLLVLQIMLILGIFDGLNIRMAPYLMISVAMVAGALVPAAAQALERPGDQQGDASPARPMP